MDFFHQDALMEKTQVIFFGLRTTTYYIFQKSEKKSLAEPGPVGRGVTNMEKYFFAFLDELDHLEAIKKILIS